MTITEIKEYDCSSDDIDDLSIEMFTTYYLENLCQNELIDKDVWEKIYITKINGEITSIEIVIKEVK